jgi:hypothetical protein
VVLWSASRLGPALRIYESAGFVHTPFTPPGPYADADVHMTLELQRRGAGA